jgi:beta-lactamase regulating signal transducer with metallopeptidase domain
MTAWLLTWLWQGLLVTAVAALTLRFWNRLNAAMRHGVWLAVLILVGWLGWMALPEPSSTEQRACTADVSCLDAAVEPIIPVQPLPELFFAGFLGLWASAALAQLIRVLAAGRAVSALRNNCTPFPPPLEAQLPLWSDEKHCGRSTRLMICPSLAGATVLGFRHPWIAMPQSLVDALSIEELDQVVLHEYAHVQRRDDWLRLAQALVQSALWVHPAVALICRWLNLEREIACDEWVVRRTGRAKQYARCLVRAAECCRRTTVEPLFAPTLFGTQHQMVRRVDRLLSTNGRLRGTPSFAAAMGCVCVLAAVSTHVSAIPLVGELIAVTLPHVVVPEMRLLTLTQPEISTASVGSLGRATVRPTVRLKPDPTFRGTSGGGERPDTTSEIADLDDRGQADASTSPQLMVSKVFDGAYEVPQAFSDRASSESAWQRAAAAGTQIGETAEKGSVRLANAFTRAGVSLARRF